MPDTTAPTLLATLAKTPEKMRTTSVELPADVRASVDAQQPVFPSQALYEEPPAEYIDTVERIVAALPVPPTAIPTPLSVLVLTRRPYPLTMSSHMAVRLLHYACAWLRAAGKPDAERTADVVETLHRSHMALLRDFRASFGCHPAEGSLRVELVTAVYSYLERYIHALEFSVYSLAGLDASLYKTLMAAIAAPPSAGVAQSTAEIVAKEERAWLANRGTLVARAATQPPRPGLPSYEALDAMRADMMRRVLPSLCTQPPSLASATVCYVHGSSALIYEADVGADVVERK